MHLPIDLKVIYLLGRNCFENYPMLSVELAINTLDFFKSQILTGIAIKETMVLGISDAV